MTDRNPKDKQVESSDQLYETCEINFDEDHKSAMNKKEFNWLKHQAQQAESMGYKYESASLRNKSLNNNINLFLLIILALTGGGSLVNNIFNLSIDDPNFGIQITVTVLTLFAVLLQSIQKIFNSDQKAIKHHETASSYLNFAREVRLQLMQGVDTRRNEVEKYLIEVENHISEIEANSMQI